MGPRPTQAAGDWSTYPRLIQASGVDYPKHCCALLIGGLQVDLDVESPVVVARRVVEDLTHPPHVGLPVDDQHCRSSGVGTGAHVVVLIEVAANDVLPALGRPPGAGIQLAEVVPAAPREQLHPAE